MANTNETADETRTDEESGILVEEFLRIHDPESDEVYYEGRT